MAVGWGVGSAVVGSVVTVFAAGVGSAAQAAKKMAAITAAKKAMAVRFFDGKDTGLICNSGTALIHRKSMTKTAATIGMRGFEIVGISNQKYVTIARTEATSIT